MTPRLVLLLAIVALLPVGRASELPLLMASIWGVADAIRGRGTLREDPAFVPMGLVFLAYWIPELASAFDSVAPQKSWTEAALDLRYAPFLWFTRVTLGQSGSAGKLLAGLAVLTAILVGDALVQATIGMGLGGPLQADRLSGMFGENLKLGPVLAAVAPWLIIPVMARFGRPAAFIAWLLLAIAVLLAGARAGWVSFALVSLLLLRNATPSGRLFLAALAGLAFTGLATSVALYHVSDAFAERIHRTSTAFQGSESAIDHALAFRLPIWRAAIDMGCDHPVNGVGVRAFRHAYEPYAEAGDRWITDGDGIGAYHAHQIALELFSETGIIGVIAWSLAAAFLIRLYRRQPPDRRTESRPHAYMLVSMLFPLNTHYAVYSSFWGTMVVLAVAFLLATLLPIRKASP